MGYNNNNRNNNNNDDDNNVGEGKAVVEQQQQGAWNDMRVEWVLYGVMVAGGIYTTVMVVIGGGEGHDVAMNRV